MLSSAATISELAINPDGGSILSIDRLDLLVNSSDVIG